VKDASRPIAVVVVNPPSVVDRALRFLSEDLSRIAGVEVARQAAPPGDGPYLEVRIAREDPRWEAYEIRIDERKVTLLGSNARGTAFAVYELCERLGQDPLHHWTGYRPARRLPLVLKGVHRKQPPPTFRFRGLFHDDEDVLPRPRLPDGIPDPRGTVPVEWYERYFETALRLRLNMVAPWVRTVREREIVRMAHEWGLFYTSHHYDTLLSDPYHFTRGKLAEKRGIKPVWSWTENREGLMKYWRCGVEETRDFDCIWPVGMRGTNDYAYRFPKDWTREQKLMAFEEALDIQVKLVRDRVPPGRASLFHFTMYTEMLPLYQTGKLPVPEGVIVVWPDNNDGRMRALPEKRGKHPHGVYYHLAYLGRSKTMQSHQVVGPDLIEKEFRNIVEAGATEFCLVNVSELREYVLGVRLVADICWNASGLFRAPDTAGRWLGWWCREYFGEKAASAVREAYEAYFAMMPKALFHGYGAGKCLGAVPSLRLKLTGKTFTPARMDTLPTLLLRRTGHRSLLKRLARARDLIENPGARRFFFENLELAAAMDRLSTEAGTLLVEAMAAPDLVKARRMCFRALPFLDELDILLRKAERPPFTGWYGPTWIRQRTRKLVTARAEVVKLLMGL